MRFGTIGRVWPNRAVLGILAAACVSSAGFAAARIGLPDGVQALGGGVPGGGVPGAGVTRPGEAARLPPEPAAGIAARVVLGPGGRDLRLSGDLTEGVAARVAALLAEHPAVERIHLTSDGGLVEEGEAIGALVARRGLATYVPDACASACTLIFVRGRARYLAAGGRLGFHAPYETDDAGRFLPVDAAPERAAYLRAGIAADFTAEALAVASAEIWIPDANRLRAAGVITEVVGTDRFPDSTLDDDASPAAARAHVLRNLPVLAGLDDPAIDRLAAWYRDGYAAGRSEAEAVAGLRLRANALLRRRFRAADDDTLRDLGAALRTAMRAEREGGGDCAAIAAGDLVAADAALRAADPSGAGLAALVGRVHNPGSTDAPVPPARASAAARRPCAGQIEAVRRALRRPVREAAASVRALFLTGGAASALASID